jgi:DNA polymerase III sliding clamp (beta) subunit (PCNA family)
VPQVAAKHLSGLKIEEIGTNNGWLFCKSGELTFACRTYQEKYPDMAGFLTKTGDPITFPQGLTEALAAASVFSDIENKSIKIEIKGGKLSVRAENDAGWFEEQSADIDFAGERTILINPLFLSTLLKHGSNCELSDNVLIVRNDSFTHVAALCVKQ